MTFDMSELLSEVTGKIQAILPGEVIISAGMPEVKADRAQISLLFEELIENGLRFNRSAEPRVHINWYDETLDWRFEVLDNGIGIDPRYHDHIFQMFSRLNKPDQFSGSGTGLSVARRIATEHRGELEVGPHPGGEGTRFIVRLPKESRLLTSPGFRLKQDRSPI